MQAVIGKMLWGQTSNFYIPTFNFNSKHDHFVVNNQQLKTANSGQQQTVDTSQQWTTTKGVSKGVKWKWKMIKKIVMEMENDKKS